MPTPRANSALGAPLVLAVAGCLLLSGCGASFDPDGDEAVAARSAGDVMAERLLDQVTAGARPVGSALFDQCTEGRHDWKRNDDYDHECDLAHSRVVAGAQNVDEVESALLEMHARVLAAGCTVDRALTALDKVAEVYWPTRRTMADPSPGMIPSGRYSCASGTGPAVELEIAPYAAGRGERFDLRPDVLLTPYIATRTQRSEPFPGPTAATVAGSGLALHFVVTAKVAYLVV